MTDEQSREHEELSLKASQDIEKAMRPVMALADREHGEDGFDSEHQTLASGICALRDADKITCARVGDVRDIVDRIDKRGEQNGNGAGYVIKKGFMKGWPVRYAFLGAIALGCAALLCGTLIVIYAVGHGKANELIEVYKGVTNEKPNDKDPNEGKKLLLANGRDGEHDTGTP